MSGSGILRGISSVRCSRGSIDIGLKCSISIGSCSRLSSISSGVSCECIICVCDCLSGSGILRGISSVRSSRGSIDISLKCSISIGSCSRLGSISSGVSCERFSGSSILCSISSVRCSRGCVYVRLQCIVTCVNVRFRC